MIDNNMSLKDAKEHLKNNWKDGTTCPCCSQVVKLYETKINFHMAKVLIQMVKLTEIGKEYIHVMEETKTQNGTYARLRFWGLIEPMGEDAMTKIGIKKSSGYWRVTPLGAEFAINKIKIIESKFIYNNNVYANKDYKPKFISIKDALNNKFNYSELMEGFKAWDSIVYTLKMTQGLIPHQKELF